MHAVLQQLLDKDKVRILNVYGIDGIGRTRFVQEVAYYLSARYKFKDGLFMFDLKKIRSVESLKTKIKDFNVNIENQIADLNFKASQKNVLLIFDNFDCLMKYN